MEERLTAEKMELRAKMKDDYQIMRKAEVQQRSAATAHFATLRRLVSKRKELDMLNGISVEMSRSEPPGSRVLWLPWLPCRRAP